MRHVLFTFALSAILAVPASAQPPGPFPVAPSLESNYARAYRYFQNSPYNFRTLSTSRPGYGEAVITPFSRHSSYLESDYLNLRVTPYGAERHVYVPGYGGSLATPWEYHQYHVPGQYRSEYYPPPPPPVWLPPGR